MRNPMRELKTLAWLGNWTVVVVLLGVLALGLAAQEAPAVPQPVERTFALRTTDGYYLTAEKGGGSSVHTDRKELGPWETFTLVSVAPGVFAFRTANGNYLCDMGRDEREGRQARSALGASKNTVDTSTQFKIMLINPDGSLVALVTAAGKYVTAENNGGVKAKGTRAMSTDREEIGSWEQFQLVDIERENRRKSRN